LKYNTNGNGIKMVEFNIEETRKAGVNSFFEIVDIFDKYDLEYWLDFGTVLGAYRDGGIIPWDGEFDISTWDENIDENSTLWEEIEDYNYAIEIKSDNIKITKKDLLIGSFTIDLHRYKKNDQNAVYLYGRLPISIIGKMFYVIEFIFKSSLKIEKQLAINFESLYKHIMDNQIGPVDTIENNNYILSRGRYPINPFGISYESKAVQYFPYKKKNRILMLLIRILTRFPDQGKKLVIGVISRICSKIATKPARIIEIPREYFDKLTKIDFLGRSFKCSKNIEKYLVMIYGEDWKTPKTAWDISKDSPTFKNSSG
jgi:phosphorylcholine metabolism protein LicD